VSPAARLVAQDVLGRKHRMFAFFSIPALRLIVNEKFPCWLFFFFLSFLRKKKIMYKLEKGCCWIVGAASN